MRPAQASVLCTRTEEDIKMVWHMTRCARWTQVFADGFRLEGVSIRNKWVYCSEHLKLGLKQLQDLSESHGASLSPFSTSWLQLSHLLFILLYNVFISCSDSHPLWLNLQWLVQTKDSFCFHKRKRTIYELWMSTKQILSKKCHGASDGRKTHQSVVLPVTASWFEDSG